MLLFSNFSILGLKAEATDDDIKKYYRRQAVLVHPDIVSIIVIVHVLIFFVKAPADNMCTCTPF